ncbi:MAG: hypothetical protein E3J86_02395 [Candidatus Thorarchaeota archaeon]|nr:MAG: hypothetical protein E3J86_02395 [Candidatus Thorarchaeota archaeon]
MQNQILCPECGKRLRKGSTFCISCGNKIPKDVPIAPPEPALGESTMNEPLDNSDVLPSLDESVLDEEPAAATDENEPEKEDSSGDETPTPAPIEGDLNWDDSSLPVIEESAVGEDLSLLEENPEEIESSGGRSTDLTWDDDEIKEGMPFKEIEPPRVFAEEIAITPEEAIDHLFPDGRDEETRNAVAHLFPEGRGATSTSFIDVVVGKPSKIGPTQLSELGTPACPNCGTSLSSDDFEYPTYVFDAMGRARLEQGMMRLKDNEHEKAIDSFETAKMLYEKAQNEKGVQESSKRVNLGYDSMARFHFDQGDNHLKVHEYEWAVVQFRKARELYMFSTDAKKRARCNEKVRESYVEWGRYLEAEGDRYSKEGRSRDALGKYQEAAAKFREGEEKKRLKGLDKKIRKA